MPSIPVLIVGAGPAGLFLALSLLRNGVRVRIIEKDAVFHRGTRGAGIQARTLELMQFMGILPEVFRFGRPLPLMRSYKLPGGTDPLATWSMLQEVEPTPSSPHVKGLMLSQALLEGILRDEIAKYDTHVELGMELVAFSQDSEGVTARVIVHANGTDSTEEIRADFLAGADGARGVVRKLLGLSFLGNTEDADGMVVSDAVVKGLSHDFWHVWINKGGVSFSIRPVDQSQDLFSVHILGFDFNPAEASGPSGLNSLWLKHIGRTDIKIDDPQWMSFFRPNMRMVNKFSEGRVFVLGDGAHVHSPTGGQGMNSSVQDSFNLAWKIALVHKGLASVSLLDTYNEERLPVIAEMLKKTTGLYKKTSDKADDPKTGSLFRGRELFMLGINYRWSSIVTDTRKPAQANEDLDDLQARSYGGYDDSICAGDRAPDAPELLDSSRADNTSTSLFDTFDPARHTLLIFVGPRVDNEIKAILTAARHYPHDTVQTAIISRERLESPLDADRTLIDIQGHAFTAYLVDDKETTVVIVRPDGFIGGIVRTVDEITSYFSRIFDLQA